ncbi:MAG: NAD(P)-dependent oxidoreductase, partial [Allobranchiibius sp.]
AFAAMKQGAYFVNTARGEIVDEAALEAALESGQLSGAALDVFDPEPPEPGSTLVRRPDVIGTPHLAGASRQVASESVAKVVAEVAEFLKSGQIAHCANPDSRSASA